MDRKGDKAKQPEGCDETEHTCQNMKEVGGGIRSRVLLSFGAVAGMVLQFPENAPTTYAEVRGNRLGAFESWEAAIRAVDKAADF